MPKSAGIKSWSAVTFGQVFTFIGGGTPDKKEPRYWNGGLPWASVKDFGSKYISETQDHITEDGFKNSASNKAFPGDLILLTRISPGQPSLPTSEIAINQDCKIVRPESCIDPEWAYYAFLQKKSEIREKSSGTTVLGVRLNALKDIQLSLPPLNEQKRIVEKIEELFSELDQSLNSLNTAHEQLQAYRQSLLKHAFEGKLTEQWRRDHAEDLESGDELLGRVRAERQARYEQALEEWKSAVAKWEASGRRGKKPKKPKKPKTLSEMSSDFLAKLPVLPKEWRWERLGWVSMGVEYGTSAKSAKSGEVPVVRMGNLQNGKIVWDDLAYSSDSDEIEKYELRPGDVVFNRTNSPELVGKVAVFRGDRRSLFAGYLIRINHMKDEIDSDFINYFLMSKTAIDYGAQVKTDGVNQSNINGEKLANYPFPYCSWEEQRTIVEKLNSSTSYIENMEKAIGKALRDVDALRFSILRSAFEGRLVPQDPNDEPASELIARIQDGKEEANGTPDNKRRSA